MVAFSSLLSAGLLVAVAQAAPTAHQKRIAQVISDSTKQWVAACTKAGGKDQCGTIAQTAFTTLLAAGKNCDQQDAADQMVSLAKTLKNDAEMIRLAQLFVQQPRNAPDSLQVPYCQTAPKNAELNGLFHCQFQGTVKSDKFSGDQTGNLPLGVKAVNPPGSCPALNKPVPDGEQLNTLVQSPGTPQGAGRAAAARSPAAAADTAVDASADPAAGARADTAVDASADPAAGASADPAAGASADTAGDGNAPDASAASLKPAPPTGAAAAPRAAAATGAKFPQNGPAAQKLNAQFAALTASSPCNQGEQACVNGGFAQCVGAKFSITQCAGGTQCFALPLVNKEGTSVTCSTQADATARIAATGASGGISG